MHAPKLVISVTAHGRTPVGALKNSRALLAIFVLPIDLRSFISITRVLNEPLVDPAAAVMPAPDFSADELAANGPSWNSDSPEVRNLRPFRLRALKNSKMIVAIRSGRRAMSSAVVIAHADERRNESHRLT
jgi:hypothetical protein